MSDKSFTYKLVKYLLIAKICVGIIFSFIVLFLFVVMTSHHSSDGKTKGLPEVDDQLFYHHEQSSSMDSKSSAKSESNATLLIPCKVGEVSLSHL